MKYHTDDHPEFIEGCYPCKLGTVRWGGLYSLARLRDAGKTGRELGKENVERFRADKGYDPISSTERWI